MDYTLKNFFLALILACVASFFGSYCKAETIDPSQTSVTSNLQAQMIGQNFIATQDWITGVRWDDTNLATTLGQAQFHLCYGTINNASEAVNATSTCSHAVPQMDCYTNTDSGIGTSECVFDIRYATTPGQDYYFILYATTTPVIGIERASGNPYTDGTSFYFFGGSYGYSTTYDFTFGIVYDPDIYYEDAIGSTTVIELPEWEGNIYIGSETLIQYNRYNLCFLGNECKLRFNYSFNAVGSDLLLYDYDTITLIDYTTLEEKTQLQTSFIISDPGSEEIQQYCIILDDGVNEAEVYCDIQIEWIDNTWCDSQYLCDDISTTTEFLYGIQCGARQTFCWLFNPTDDSIEYFSKQINNFQKSFPFNLVFGIIDEINQDIEATSTGANFGIPLVSTTTGEFYQVNGIDDESYDEMFGTTTMDTLNTYASYVIWIVTALIIIFIIYKYAIL